MNLVTIMTFSNRVEADILIMRLRSEGFYVELQSDDEAGLNPALSMRQGVKVLIRKNDLDAVQELLESLEKS